jgi:hypothetical protein
MAACVKRSDTHPAGWIGYQGPSARVINRLAYHPGWSRRCKEIRHGLVLIGLVRKISGRGRGKRRPLAQGSLLAKPARKTQPCRRRRMKPIPTSAPPNSEREAGSGKFGGYHPGHTRLGHPCGRRLLVPKAVARNSPGPTGVPCGSAVEAPTDAEHEQSRPQEHQRGGFWNRGGRRINKQRSAIRCSDIRRGCTTAFAEADDVRTQW